MSYLRTGLNYKVCINELNADFSGWVEILLLDTRISNTAPDYTGGMTLGVFTVKDGTISISFQLSIYPSDAAYYESTHKYYYVEFHSAENYSVVEALGDVPLNPSPTKCGNVYVVLKNDYVDVYEKFEDFVTDTKCASVKIPANFPKTYSKYMSKYNSNQNLHIMPWYNTITPIVGLSNYIVPILTAPTAFVYIKVKEESENGNQQTDTPTP